MEIVKKQMTLHHTVSVIGGFMAGYTIINHSDILANAQTGNLIRLVLSAFEGNLLSIGYIVLLFLTYAASCIFYTVFRRYSPLSMKIVSRPSSGTPTRRQAAIRARRSSRQTTSVRRSCFRRHT